MDVMGIEITLAHVEQILFSLSDRFIRYEYTLLEWYQGGYRGYNFL